MGNAVDYQFIRMVTGEKPRTWIVLNKRHGDVLGTISFYPAWRQFVFEAEPGCVFSSGCMRDVAAFCDEQRRQVLRPSKQLTMHVVGAE